MPSDSRKPPPHGLSGYPRPKSQPGGIRDGGESRDAESYEARREREARERAAAPIAPSLGHEDLTGQYEGEQLAAMRAGRPIGERVAILEVKHDNVRNELAAMRLTVGDTRLEAQAARVKADQVLDRVAGIKADVGEVKGRLDSQDMVLGVIAADVKRAAERDHVSVLRRVEIEKAGELAQVDIQRAEALADVDLRKEQELDTIKKRRYRRKVTLAIIGLLSSGAGLIKLFEYIWRHL